MTCSRRPDSTTRPAYITCTRSASEETTPRSWLMRTTETWRSSTSSRNRRRIFGLDRYVQGGRRLVGQQDLRLTGQGDGDGYALAQAAGELVRPGSQSRRRIGHTDRAEQVDGPTLGRGGVKAQVVTQVLGELSAHVEQGVEAGRGVLPNHGDLPAAHARQPASRRAPKLLAPVTDAPGHLQGGRQEAQDGQGGQRLAAPALATDPEHLAPPEREVHPVDQA